MHTPIPHIYTAIHPRATDFVNVQSWNPITDAHPTPGFYCDGDKQCRTCLQPKPPSEFYQRGNHCKECISNKNKTKKS